jgi:hypothetical protein
MFGFSVPLREKLCAIIRPYVIDSMFQVPWPPEIGACALPTQHKVNFQHSRPYISIVDVCVENFQNLERSMSYAFSIAMHCMFASCEAKIGVRTRPEP